MFLRKEERGQRKTQLFLVQIPVSSNEKEIKAKIKKTDILKIDVVEIKE